MSQYSDIVENFDAVMTGEIPGIEVNEWRKCATYISLAQAPSVMFHKGYAILLQSLPVIGSEVNAIYFSTFTIRLQLAVVMSDKEAYDGTMAEIEAILRQRTRIETYQGVFRQLKFNGAVIEPVEHDEQWYQLFNCDFEVTVQGT